MAGNDETYTSNLRPMTSYGDLNKSVSLNDVPTVINQGYSNEDIENLESEISSKRFRTSATGIGLFTLGGGALAAAIAILDKASLMNFYKTPSVKALAIIGGIILLVLTAAFLVKAAKTIWQGWVQNKDVRRQKDTLKKVQVANKNLTAHSITQGSLTTQAYTDYSNIRLRDNAYTALGMNNMANEMAIMGKQSEFIHNKINYNETVKEHKDSKSGLLDKDYLEAVGSYTSYNPFSKLTREHILGLDGYHVGRKI